MEQSEILKREIKVLVFDQYGTIVDMQKGLTEAVGPFLEKKGWTGKPNSFALFPAGKLWRALSMVPVTMVLSEAASGFGQG